MGILLGPHLQLMFKAPYSKKEERERILEL